MIRNNSRSVIAAAVFAALSTAAVAQTSSQSTDASQSAQTNPIQSVNPSAMTGVQSNVEASGSNNNVRMNSSATTNL